MEIQFIDHEEEEYGNIVLMHSAVGMLVLRRAARKVRKTSVKLPI
jgi:hypothetical protein